MVAAPVTRGNRAHAQCLTLVGCDLPRRSSSGAAKVLINGWPFLVVTWSPDAWSGLPHKPADAIPSTDGCWVALRSA